MIDRTKYWAVAPIAPLLAAMFLLSGLSLSAQHAKAQGVERIDIVTGSVSDVWNPTFNGGDFSGATIDDSRNSIVGVIDSGLHQLNLLGPSGLSRYDIVTGNFQNALNPTLSGGDFGGTTISGVATSNVVGIIDTLGFQLHLLGPSGINRYDIVSGNLGDVWNPTISGSTTAYEGLPFNSVNPSDIVGAIDSGTFQVHLVDAAPVPEPPGEPLLSVDFGHSSVFAAAPTQTGFSPFLETDTSPKTFGAYTVSVSGHEVQTVGGFLTRNALSDVGEFANADLYDDFIFTNGSGPISVVIDGLEANTPYDITWYVYDRFDDGGGGTYTSQIAPAAGSNTTGDTVWAVFDSTGAPTANDQYAYTGTWTSTGTSLEIDLSYVSHVGEDYAVVRANGLEVSQTPPPPPPPGEPLLSVDFGHSSVFAAAPTQTGFSPFLETDTSPKTFGAYTVSVSGHEVQTVGGFLTRNALSDVGAFTNADLYDDFIFTNDGGPISVVIDGLEANTPYDITWYVYDRFDDSGGGTYTSQIAAAAGSNTTGDTVWAVFNSTAAPTANDQYAYTGTWTSTDTSLEIDLSHVSHVGEDFAIVRINGFEISPTTQAVPEPSTFALGFLGLLGLGWYARRRRR